MHAKAILLATLFGFGWSLSGAYVQAKADRVYSDPDEMRLLVPTAVAQAANHALTTTERAVLCRQGRGFIEFWCEVDGNGRIQSITGVLLYQAARAVPAPMLAKMKERIRQDVIFHVPDVNKLPTSNHWRRPSYTLPLAVFCR